MIRALRDLVFGRRKPKLPPFTHPRYGTFTEFRDAGFYGPSTIEWQGQPVAFTPDTVLHKQVDPGSIATMDALMADQPGWTAQVMAAITRDLYQPWRDDWWQGEGPEPGEAAFLDQMRIIAITTGSNGDFSFDVDCGALFGEHAIVAAGSLAGGIVEAYYEG